VPVGDRRVPIEQLRPTLGRVAVACLAVGVGLMLLFEAAWAHAVGVVALFGFLATGFVALATIAAAGDTGSD